MAKRIPKLTAPEEIQSKVKSETLTDFCEVYIPMAPSVYTYGVPLHCSLKRGDVVWVQFANRKKPAIAIVNKITQQRPAFDVRLAFKHQSGYSFSERYMDTLEWTSKYYISTPMKSLFAFFPAEFDRYLEALAFENSKDALGDTPNKMTPAIIELKKPDAPPLTEEQEAALAQMLPPLVEKKFCGMLLHGVTGSGKTRVYQELAFEALKLNKKVLILVPEIGLTPQTAKRFEDYLQVPIVILHSALSAPKKREGYLQILKGNAKVVLGTRSALLSPFDFDVVILDEEHDSSYKQQDPTPRYHTRELAYHIAYKYSALVILGSATPSLETFYNGKSKHIKVLSLTKRATAAKLPDVKIIDMKQVKQQKGILMSPALRDALTECIAKGNQAIVLMNRRGFSKMRVCTECGETLYCKNCHIPLVYHKQYHALMCHYCASLYPLDSPCSACGKNTYEFVGGAIEMLEDEINEWVPNAKVIRMDRDTTQNVGASEKILEEFRNKNFNILLGTQMVAKGHDFPGVHLVGIVGADAGGLPDFRSSERLYQLLSQTAGRAGRAGGEGLVLIQTLKPSEPVMQFAIHHDFEGFAAKELDDRRLAFYPPFCKLVEISCGSRDKNLLTTTAERLAEICRREKSLTVMGPVDAFVSMVQNVHWSKLYIKTQDLSPIRRLINPIINSVKPWVQGVEIKVEIE